MSGQPQAARSGSITPSHTQAGEWDVRLEPSDFHWAVLRVDGLGPTLLKRPASRATLESAFAAEVPVPIDDLAMAFVCIPDDAAGTPRQFRILACGLPSTRLSSPDLSHALSISPNATPPWLTDDSVESADLRELNVLTGRYTPQALKAARKRLSMTRTAAAAVVLTAIAIGLGYAGHQARRDTETARHFAEQLAQEARSVLPGEGDASFRAKLELKRLRATRAHHARRGVLDAAAALETVLAHWPSGSTARTMELTINSAGIAIRAEVPDNERAAALAAALTARRSPGAPRATEEISSMGNRRLLRLTLPHSIAGEIP